MGLFDYSENSANAIKDIQQRGNGLGIPSLGIGGGYSPWTHMLMDISNNSGSDPATQIRLEQSQAIAEKNAQDRFLKAHQK